MLLTVAHNVRLNVYEMFWNLTHHCISPSWCYASATRFYFKPPVNSSAIKDFHLPMLSKTLSFNLQDFPGPGKSKEKIQYLIGGMGTSTINLPAEHYITNNQSELRAHHLQPIKVCHSIIAAENVDVSLIGDLASSFSCLRRIFPEAERGISDKNSTPPRSLLYATTCPE